MNFVGTTLVTANSEMNNSLTLKAGLSLNVKEVLIPNAYYADCLSIGMGYGG